VDRRCLPIYRESILLDCWQDYFPRSIEHRLCHPPFGSNQEKTLWGKVRPSLCQQQGNYGISSVEAVLSEISIALDRSMEFK